MACLPEWDEFATRSRLLAASMRGGVPVYEPELRRLKAVVETDCDYSRQRLLAAFERRPWWKLCACKREEGGTDDGSVVLEMEEYERHNWGRALRGDLLVDAYIVRKGLQRKAQLAKYLTKYISKHPACPLARLVPETIIIDMWDAFGDDTARSMGLSKAAAIDVCCVEAEEAMAATEVLGELGGIAETSASRWWILKPSLTNKGAEIAVVEQIGQVKDVVAGAGRDVMEWVLQRYVPRPLLIGSRKFHLRVYVLAVGALKVYVYEPILALFAMRKYGGATADDLYAHLTNTAYQATVSTFKYDRYVRLLSELPRMLRSSGIVDAESKVGKVYTGIRTAVAHLFEAFRGEFNGFMPIPNAFELFGLDFLVTDEFEPILLEVNCRPDVKQTGTRLGTIIDDLQEGIVQLAVDSTEAVQAVAAEWIERGEVDSSVQMGSPRPIAPTMDDGVTRERVPLPESCGAARLFDLVYFREADAGSAAPSMRFG